MNDETHVRTNLTREELKRVKLKVIADGTSLRAVVSGLLRDKYADTLRRGQRNGDGRLHRPKP